jgi:hypothetical protein
MPKGNWEPGTVYLKTSGHIEEHHCWNRSRFIASQIEAVEAVNKKRDGPAITIEVVTAEDYAAQRFVNKRRPS